MSAALGILLAAGLLLIASPFLWPRRRRRRPQAPRLIALGRDRLVQAGLARVGLGTVGVVSVVLGLGAGALVFALVPVVIIAAAAGIAVTLVPSAVISWRARTSRRAARVAWPDVVDQLVSGVRSGLALPDAVVVLATTGPALTRQAFATFAADYRLTGNFSVCLDGLKRRLADPVADRILETLRMSREVGGSELTIVLRNLAIYLRTEGAMRSEIEARQSWVMNAAKLGVAAPWVVLLLLATRPEAAAAYNTAAGTALIVCGLIVSFIAYRVMLAIARLPEERRWFA